MFNLRKLKLLFHPVLELVYSEAHGHSLAIIRDHLEFGSRFAGHWRLLTPVSPLRLKEAAGAGTQLSKQKITGFKVQKRGWLLLESCPVVWDRPN